MFTELMDRFNEFSATWFWLVLLATWRALPIFVIVAATFLALRQKLAPALQSLLLTIIIVRLLIPISIGSPVSLHKPIDSWFMKHTEHSNHRNRPIMTHDSTLPVLSAEGQNLTQYRATPVQMQSDHSVACTWEGGLYVAMMCLPILISIWLLFRSVSSHVRFAIKLGYCRKLEQRPLIDLLLRECDSLAVGRRPVLREVQWLTAPAVFGLFRQSICLPPHITETLSEQELRLIFRHELAHVRRRDIPVIMIASIATATHWFNPIVWGILSRLRAAMEAAADRVALQDLSQNEVSAYGQLLLRFAEGSMSAKNLPTLGLIAFASGEALKLRVELLLSDRKPKKLSDNLLSAGFVGLIAIAGLTDARKANEQMMPSVHLITSDSMQLQSRPVWNEPLGELEPESPTFVVTYDVTTILDTMPTSLQQTVTSPLEQLVDWIPMLTSYQEKLQLENKLLSADLTSIQHRQLKHTLEIWKNGEPRQIAVEATLIQTDIRTASTINWVEHKIDGLTVRGLGPAMAARIDESELEQLIRIVSADPSGNIMLAPKVTLFDGQSATIADQVQRPFVTGVNPEADGRMQPIVSVVHEGLSIELMPKAGDDESISLAFEFNMLSVSKVSFAYLPIKASKNADPLLTVQVPATEEYELSSSVVLAPGESVVVAIPRVFSNEPGADAESTLIVALTPRLFFDRP